jgi:hypothetical protein
LLCFWRLLPDSLFDHSWIRMTLVTFQARSSNTTGGAASIVTTDPTPRLTVSPRIADQASVALVVGRLGSTPIARLNLSIVRRLSAMASARLIDAILARLRLVSLSTTSPVQQSTAPVAFG